jgi:aldose 1-epimerase
MSLDLDMQSFTLGHADSLQAEILAFGGILRRLRLATPAGPRDLVLSLPELANYASDQAYLGAVAGRVANRIAGARFVLSGRVYELTANEGPNHLHGGALGLGKRWWQVTEVSHDTLGLTYSSPAGEEGYPGSLQIEARFCIEGTSLLVDFSASTDATTPVSLTYHPYFNLSGDPHRPVVDHMLRIPASKFLPVDPALLPTGELAEVDGTPFDFRRARGVRATEDPHPQLQLAGGYDHCWVLDGDADCAAELHSVSSGITLRLLAPGPGLQLYGGHGLARQHPRLGNGLCLEPQGLPNAVNVPQFPSVLVHPGEAYHKRFRYAFSYAG